MKTFLRITILLPLIALSLLGCKRGGSSSAQATRGAHQQEITINITSEPQTLDPRKVRALNDANVIRMFMDGLTRTDKEGITTLAVAKKVDISPDQKTYTFTLRESHWSNGDQVTSHDFAYAWKKSLTPTFVAPNANLLYVIKNAKEANTGNLPLSLLGVETPDEKTLVVHLNHPTPYFLDLIAHPIYFPVNAKVDRSNSHWAEKETSYVGNGPFTLLEWKHHNTIVAEKNPRYWDHKAVSLSHVKMVMVSEDTGFKMFDAKDTSWDGSPYSAIPIDAIQTLKTAEQLRCTPALATSWIRVNIEVPPFDSKKLRKAFALAIDRQAIVEHVLQGQQIPATGIVPKAMGLSDRPYFNDADIAASQELFNEVLDEMGVSASNFPEVVLTYGSGERAHSVVQALQSQWQTALGIRVRLEPVEKKVYFDRVSNKNYTLALGDWFADFGDPINFLEVFTANAGTNNTNWKSPSYGELLETSYQTSDKEERRQVLHRSEELIMSEMPVIPLYHYTMLYIQDDNLKDVVLTTMGGIDFKWAHVDNE